MKSAFFLFTALFSAAVSAAPAIHMDIKATTEAVSVYYRNPNPDRALKIMQTIIADPLWKKDSARHNLSVWAAQILRQHPQATDKWCRTMKQYPAVTQDETAYFFFLANTSESRKCLRSLKISDHAKAYIAQNTPPDISSLSNISPADLDALWTNFYATGNPKAVEKVLDRALYYAKAQKAQEKSNHKNIDMTGAAAAWSSRSNIMQNQDIRKIFETYLNRLNATDKALLQKMLIQE